MTKLIQNQEQTHALHALNYHKIRDGLFNVTKWHDNGFNTYTFSSNDLVEVGKTVGKQLMLQINNPHNAEGITYIVTYRYETSSDDATIVIEQSDTFGNTYPLNDLAHPSGPMQTNKMYDILYHVEKTIKRDLQAMMDTAVS